MACRDQTAHNLSASRTRNLPKFARPFLLLACGLPVLGSVEAAEIRISWISVEHEVRPKQAEWRTPKTVTLSLRGGNTISESYAVLHPNGRTTVNSSGGNLRDPMALASTITSSWRVGPNNTLIRSADRPQHVETIRVSVSASNSCSAKISFQLKPGFHEYRMQSLRGPIYLSALRAEQVTCSAAD